MCDLLKKNGINIDVKALSKKLGCPIIETSALKKTGLKEVIAEAIKVAKSHATGTVSAIFEGSVEDKVSAIEAELPSSIPEAEKRIKTRLVLEKVVEVENVEVSDEKLDEQINEIAASYKLEGAKLKEMMGEREKEQIREDLKVQAAIDLLVEQAKLA
jgi:Fe2+ transport system protein B